MNYKVLKNGELLRVHSCKVYPKPYNSTEHMEYVMFNVDDREEIVIESETEIKSAVIRPLSAGISFEISFGKIILSVDRPVKLSVEINGSSNNNLMIFAYKEEFIGPTHNYIKITQGEYKTGTLLIEKDNTTVYIEEGATLYGNIVAKNCNNITICGRGRVCMERYTYEMRKNFARSIDIINCKNVTIKGIIIDDSNDWSMRITGCDDVNISDVKIFGCRGNSDGIDICGSRNVTVSDIFTRVWDDSFVVKALGTGNCENIIFKNSVLWNDFARPMEVGVELRADKVRNIKFENIDIIHSDTGYPLMGIHHGDHAEVSDIVFDNIRVEDTPGAQLFDIRIADSVWNRDNKMGDIRNITFSNIKYLGTDNNDILLSNSRIEGFSEKHNIRNVNFHNININGKYALTPKELGLNVYEFVDGISVTADNLKNERTVLESEIVMQDDFKPDNGFYKGTVKVILRNKSDVAMNGTAAFAISPKNTEKEQSFEYNIDPNESKSYEFNLKLQAGKYVFYLKNNKNEIENTFLYSELPMIVSGNINDCPKYQFINYYNTKCAEVRIAVKDSELIIMNDSEKTTEFLLYTAMPVPSAEGEVMFSAEETDFGEIYALLKKGNELVPAPQLRCPAEITYVFKNEPKVKEIVKTPFKLKKGETVKLTFEKLGISKNTDSFLMELEAKVEETSMLRYPYTLFHSTMPDKTAHMYGKIRIKEGK